MKEKKKRKGLYTYTSPDGRTVYIGVTQNLEQRRYCHKIQKNKAKVLLHKAFNKLGYENFSYKIILEDNNLTKKQLHQLERLFINFYEDAGFKTYNILGSSVNGFMKTVPRSTRQPAKFVAHGSDRPVKPKPHTGRNTSALTAYYPDGTKEHFVSVKDASIHFKINISTLSYHISHEMNSITNFDNEKIPVRIRKDETKISQKKPRRYLESVIQFDLSGNEIARFPSIKDAAFKTGINRSNIGACCNKKLKRAGQFRWQYDTENKNDTSMKNEQTTTDFIAEMKHQMQQASDEAKQAATDKKRHDQELVDRIRKDLRRQ